MRTIKEIDAEIDACRNRWYDLLDERSETICKQFENAYLHKYVKCVDSDVSSPTYMYVHRVTYENIKDSLGNSRYIAILVGHGFNSSTGAYTDMCWTSWAAEYEFKFNIKLFREYEEKRHRGDNDEHYSITEISELEFINQFNTMMSNTYKQFNEYAEDIHN